MEQLEENPGNFPVHQGCKVNAKIQVQHFSHGLIQKQNEGDQEQEDMRGSA
jgi:hypothetical protein